MLRSSGPSASGRRRSASSRSGASGTTSCRTSRATSSACSSRRTAAESPISVSAGLWNISVDRYCRRGAPLALRALPRVGGLAERRGRRRGRTPNGPDALALARQPDAARAARRPLRADRVPRAGRSPSASPASTSCPNNHFDQDGLVSVFALVDPDAAVGGRDASSTWPAPATSGRSSRLRRHPAVAFAVAAFRGIRPGHRSTPTSWSGSTRKQCGRLLWRCYYPGCPVLVDHPESVRSAVGGRGRLG